MNLNEPNGKKYLEIVKNHNMDDMFDFGYRLGRADMLEAVLGVIPDYLFPDGVQLKSQLREKFEEIL